MCYIDTLSAFTGANKGCNGVGIGVKVQVKNANMGDIRRLKA